MVYSTCSSYPEENEEVVSRALEQANFRSEQEGEPKQANFRSASVSVPQNLGAHSASVSVIVFLCLFASLSVSLLGCLSVSLQTGFCQSLSTPRAELRESQWKHNQSYHFMSLNAVKRAEKRFSDSLPLHRCTLYIYFFSVCECVCVRVVWRT